MSTKHKVGRPATKGRDPIRSLRVPDAEWQKWKQIAESKGLTLAMWIRKIANGAARRMEN